MRKICILIILAFLSFCGNGQNSWQKTYNTNQNVIGGGTVIQTLDGGFASVGTAPPPLTAGMNDMVLTKYDADGNVQWAQIYGGTLDEEGMCIAQAPNGNYYIGGTSKSFTSGNATIYLVAADVNGTMLWSRYEPSTTALSKAQSVKATATNGVTFFGTYYNGSSVFMNLDVNGTLLESRMFNAGSAGNLRDCYGQKIAGGYITANTDFYSNNFASQLKVVKFNAALNPVKYKLIGNSNSGYTYAKSCQQTSDAGYLISGYTNNYGSGGYDAYLTKLDSNCNMLWFRAFGNVNDDHFYDARQTSDGGCVAVGYSVSPANLILVKINSAGNTEWQRQYDLGGSETGFSVWQTSDGGYILTGGTPSGGTWLIKTDINGMAGGCNTSNWSATNLACAPRMVDEPINGLTTLTLTTVIGSDNGRTVTATALCSAPSCPVNAAFTQSADVVVDGFSVTFTNSSTNAISYIWKDGVTTFSTSVSPSYILTTPGIHNITLISSNGACTDTVFSTINVTPVVSNSNWQATYLNSYNSGYPGSIVQTIDGGYASVGSPGLTKYDANGNIQWAKSYAGANYGSVSYIAQASDGSYYLVGNMIIKTDVNGNILWSKKDSVVAGSISSIYTTSANELVLLNPWGGGTILKITISPTGSIVSSKGVNASGGVYETHGQQTSDGGSVMTTNSGFSIDKIKIVKYTSAFVSTWDREISGPGVFAVKSTRQTADGGYIVTGYTNAYGQGGNDGYILKLTSTGTTQWFRAYGDAGDNRFFSAKQTQDGGYIAAGWTGVSPNLNVILVKTGPTGSVQWAKEYNLGGDEFANTVLATTDGGYMIAGRDVQTGRTFLIKTDPNGIAGGCNTSAWGGIGFGYIPTNAASTTNSIIDYPILGYLFTAANSAPVTKTLVCSQVICSNTASISFNQPTCFGSCNASATCTPTGTSPFTYLWSNSQTGQTATGLCSGSYTVTVTDANSCTATATITVTQPTALSVGATATTPSFCTGGCTNLNINVTGGTPGYTFLWIPGNMSTSAPNVCPAVTTTYTCTVTDANGCSQTATVTVTVNSLPAVTYTETSSLVCVTWPDFTLTPGSPGGGSYSGTAVTGNQFSPSTAGQGTYTVTYTYTDGNGCTNTATSQITVDLCLGDDAGSVLDNQVSVFPNPSSGTFNLHFDCKAERVTVVDMLGRIILDNIMNGPDQLLDLTKFPDGLYFLNVYTEERMVSKRIVVVH